MSIVVEAVEVFPHCRYILTVNRAAENEAFGTINMGHGYVVGAVWDVQTGLCTKIGGNEGLEPESFNGGGHRAWNIRVDELPKVRALVLTRYQPWRQITKKLTL